MADVTDYKIFKNSQYEILTDEGFKDFRGVIRGYNEHKYIIYFYKNKLICTPKHKLMIDNTDYIFAEDLKIGDKLFNGITVIDIQKIENSDPVYEILDVKDNHRYYSNGVLSHQCLVLDEFAHVDEGIIKDFL